MSYFQTHRATLDRALEAARSRSYWSAYPEVPSGKIYGETAKNDGAAAFEGHRDSPFELDQPTDGRRVGGERSPYGFDLGITYPSADPDQLLTAAETAMAGWAAASIEDRVGVCLEILARLNRRSFEMANAVMHTTGQAFAMAFQAGGPHAQDRGLEAVAYAYAEMTRTPAEARWEKPGGKAGRKTGPVVLDKTYRVIPRGVAVNVGVSTFPTWNGYPGLFASLATGNPVIVKPHPTAILPLAITVRIGREVLAEAGFDPNALLLAADDAEAPITKALVGDRRVGLVDFTGGNAFGRWLRETVRHAQVFTEEAGVNSVVLHSTDDFEGMCANLAFSLSLYSGQMCTAPQNLYVPEGGIETDRGHKSFDEVAAGIAGAIDALLGDPTRAAAILGALQSPATAERVAEVAANEADIVRPSTASPVAGFEGARTATPLILKAHGTDAAPTEERFGPISFVVAVADADEGIGRASELARTRGAITAAIYSTDDAVVSRAADAFARAGVGLSVNLTGGVYVNQSAAFSDYHVSGANPAGNACLTDAAFVASRFRVVGVRRHAPEKAPETKTPEAKAA